MLRYTFKALRPHQHFIHICFEADHLSGDTVMLQLPTWRPGRYELGNFAGNMKPISVKTPQGKPLSWIKKTKDCWVVRLEGATAIEVSYQYYANQLDAGSCWLDETQLYVNPVHCCLYIPDRQNEKCEIQLEVPPGYAFAGSLKKTGDHPSDHQYQALDFQELADSPFIASDRLQHNRFRCSGVDFHVWFMGEVKPDWKTLLHDLEAYTNVQVAAFGGFPVKEYHYLIQVTPYSTYHGVEHQKSTVIALGPSYAIFKDRYTDLLGVCSHELYHTWNIKKIRPAEMLPYDFTQENYSRLGYVAEGVTTYFGDQMLHRSGVFNDEQYFNEFNTLISRHQDNFGRLNNSVADSSFDTWLDGYVAGVPGRKVSIYVEGALLAFIADVRLLCASGGKKSLDDVMRRLYEKFGLPGKGYTEADYKATLEAISGTSFDAFFEDLVWGTADYLPAIEEALDALGLVLQTAPSAQHHEARLGFKTNASQTGEKVVSVFPGSPADQAGLWIDDKIMVVNGYEIRQNLSGWTGYFQGEEQHFMVLRQGQLKQLTLCENGKNWFQTRKVAFADERNEAQQGLFDRWKFRTKG